MKQMPVEKQAIIDYNMEDKNLPSAVRQFQPTVFKDGSTFCCILGPSPQEGVFGCGDSPQAALKEWDKHLHQLLDGQYKVAEEVKQYIDDTLRTSKKGVW